MIEIGERHIADIADIADPTRLERIETRHMMRWTRQRRHIANLARSVTRARLGGDAAVERHAREHDIERVQIGTGRHAHECRNAAETRQLHLREICA